MSVYPFPLAERSLEVPLSGLEVALPETGLEPTVLDGAQINPLADGQVEVDFEPEDQFSLGAAQDPNDHYANLAPLLRESQLSTIAQEVEDMVRTDLDSRRPWHDRLAKGLEAIGIIDEGDDVRRIFKEASRAVHPMIAEAIIQYQARALAELYPASGPAKATVLGTNTREKTEQAKRVADYINYQLTYADRTYFAESDRALFLQGCDGSVFRKVYRDVLLGKNVSRIIKAEDFVVPYYATSLEDAARYTHLLSYTQNEMKRLQKTGFYRDVPLVIPSGGEPDAGNSQLIASRDEQEGRTPNDERPQDNKHAVREMVVDYDLPQFEDVDELGKKTGIAYPYVISVERDSMKVLAIRRGWRPNDQLKARRIQVVHYPLIRGDGFYGYGFIHLAGGLSRAATGCLRNILDNAAYVGLQGGFKTKENKLSGDISVDPGVWKDTDIPWEDLNKGFFTPPWKPVPEAMFRILGLLTELGQRYLMTTDATVGDAKNTGPVGTTVALIEQGQKVATGIHKRSHEALGQELRLLAELNGEHLPEGVGYPYEVPGESKQVFKEDFGPAVDVEPVSDPNIFSNTQRIAQSQATLELANSAPELVDKREAYRRMFTAMNVPDIDTLVPPEKQIKRCDPVTENAKAMVGAPIKVFPDQAHDAHIAVHMGQLQMMGAQGSASLQVAQQTLIPHIQEHEAQSMRIKMMTDMGVQLPPLEEAEDEEPRPELPPQVENQIAMKAAQIMQQLTQQLQAAQAQAQGQPAQDQAAADKAQDIENFKAEQQRKDAALELDEKRKDVKLKNDIEREDAKSGIDPSAVANAQTYLAERGLDQVIEPKKLAVTAAALGSSFDDVVKMLMWFAQQGQGQGPAPAAKPQIAGQTP